MKPVELKLWMDQNQKTVVDVASAAHTSPRTIERFLSGETKPIRIIMDAIERVVYPGMDKLGSNQNNS